MLTFSSSDECSMFSSISSTSKFLSILNAFLAILCVDELSGVFKLSEIIFWLLGKAWIKELEYFWVYSMLNLF